MSLHDALRNRFSPPAWGLIWEVGNATGQRITNYADALAMSVWPSRGLELHGIEIKTNRADWLRELGDPKKSVAVQKYCDYWWLVVEKDVVNDGELPGAWGLLVRRGERLHCVKEAPKLEAKALDRTFLAAMFRRLSDAQATFIPKSSIDKEIAAKVEEARKRGEADAARGFEYTDRDYKRLKQAVDDFERESGVRITLYQAGDIGKRFAAAQNLDHLRSEVEGFRRIRDQLMSIGGNIDRLIQDVAEDKRPADVVAIGGAKHWST